jgi:gamma-glutamyltranspeptidase/glutathione hydrolase
VQVLALVSAFVLGACETGSGIKKTVDVTEEFSGSVTADEPRAAVIGREILLAGGNAMDAATAVYFALAVTLPSSASLGGGGICVVHDAESETTEAIDFIAPAPRAVPAGATRPSAVPANPRGFFALHSKYGALRWAQVVAPAANLARFGGPVSRALARDLASVEGPLMAEAETRRVFARRDRRGTVREGETLIQQELADVLDGLRREGPVSFYRGATARRLVAGVRDAGGSLSLEDLATYTPTWRRTIAVPFGRRGMTHFAPSPAGAVAAEMWAMLTFDGDYEDASAEERPHMFAEAALRAFADRGQWLRDDGGMRVDPATLVEESRIEKLWASYKRDRHVPAAQLDPPPRPRLENPAATSFVTVALDGSAVACTLTMYNLFGTGRVAKGTGILLAASPGQAGYAPISLGPMIGTNDSGDLMFFAAAASGGVAAPTALMNVAVRHLILERNLNEAVSGKRLHHGGDPDLVYYENGYKEAILQSLTKRGHLIAQTRKLGLVNAVVCVDGLPDKPESCAAKSDPRGFGLAATVIE